MRETGWNGFLPERVQHREGMLRFSGAEGFVRNGPCLILLNDQSPRVSVSLSQYQDRDWSWEKERKSTKMFTKRTSLSPTQLRKLCSLRKKKKNYIYIFYLQALSSWRCQGRNEFLESPERSWHHQTAQVASGEWSQWLMRHPGRAGGDQPLRRKSKPTWLHALSVKALGSLLNVSSVNFIQVQHTYRKVCQPYMYRLMNFQWTEPWNHPQIKKENQDLMSTVLCCKTGPRGF